MPLGGHSREVRGFSSQRPSSSPRSPTSYRVNPTARSDEDGRRGNKGSISLKRPFESGQYSFTFPLFSQIFNSPAVPVFRSVRNMEDKITKCHAISTSPADCSLVC